MELDEESVGIFGGFDPLASVRSLLQSVGAFVVDVKDADLKSVEPPVLCEIRCEFTVESVPCW